MGVRAKRASAVDGTLRALGIQKVAEGQVAPLQWAQLEPLLCAWLRDCHLLVRENGPSRAPSSSLQGCRYCSKAETPSLVLPHGVRLPV